jgi:Holliday junction DNA helicase RuvA
VLELKGVLDTDDAGQAATGQPKASAEARDALLSMGFTSAEIDVALKGYDDTTENGKDDISAIVKYALKKLGAGV